MNFRPIIFWAMSIGCVPLVHADFPLPECREHWKHLVFAGQYSYQLNESYEQYYQRVSRSECQKEWSILIFMAADNNLSPYALADLYELESGYEFGQRVSGSTLDVDFLTEVDFINPEGSFRIHSFMQDEKFSMKTYTDLLHGKKDFSSIQSPRVSVSKELEMPLQERLGMFLRWARKFYPAKNTLLILWGHGLMGHSRSHSVVLTSDVKDDAGIQITEFSDLIKSELPELRGLIFDSCYQQTLENLSELATRLPSLVVFGSSQSQSFQGFPYRRLSYELAMRPKQKALNLFTHFGEWINQSFDPKWGRAGRVDPQFQDEVSVSSFELSKIRSIEIQLDQLGVQLSEWIKQNSQNRLKLMRALREAQSSAKQVNLYDLLVRFKKVLSANPDIEIKIEDTLQLLTASTLGSAVGDSYLAHPTTVGIWTPVSLSVKGVSFQEFPMQIHESNQISNFSKRAPHWIQFLLQL